MSEKINDGGPAFPNITPDMQVIGGPGMSLRDWFAGQCQADDRLVKCIRAMDDTALEFFARFPDSEREEHITEADFTNWAELGPEVAKITQRLQLEAKAIARVRFMQADTMIAVRGGSQ